MPNPFYDNISANEDILLDLQFREATGIVTQDNAKPHHPISLVNTPTWTTLSSGLIVLAFNGTSEYAQALNAVTADLGFTTSDYTLAGWTNWIDTSTTVKIFGRNEITILGVGVGGWELYFFGDILQLRHCHSAGATTTTGAFSRNWTPGTWQNFVVVRDGASSIHYRDGVAITTTISTGGLINPEATTQDFVIGTRYTKNTDFYKGQMWRPRIWNRALSQSEITSIYEIEKNWFT